MSTVDKGSSKSKSLAICVSVNDNSTRDPPGEPKAGVMCWLALRPRMAPVKLSTRKRVTGARLSGAPYPRRTGF